MPFYTERLPGYYRIGKSIYRRCFKFKRCHYSGKWLFLRKAYYVEFLYLTKPAGILRDVPFKEFASDIKNVTKKYYWNNKTEVQARNFEKMMPAIMGLYNGMRKNMRYYKSLKNETKKEGKATKRNKRRTHSKIKRRN